MKRVCVYCGSSSRVDVLYIEAARQLGNLLAERGFTIVYGGANVGTMGALAEGALAVGGNVIGVIPKSLVEMEVAHHGLTELFVVNDMHERKAKMTQLADAFIALPGGLGTLEELFEILTWAQLAFHSKPIGLLNVNDFFRGLINFLDHAAREKFMTSEHVSMLLESDDAAELINQLTGYQASPQTKWWSKK